MSILAHRLKESRNKINKIQFDMAKYLGITESAYQKYELGISEPKIENLIKLADCFDVSIDYLTGRTDNPKLNA